MPEPKMIAICGLDGAGKTSAIRVISETLQKAFPEKKLTMVREPGGTPFAEALRVLVKSHYNETVSPITDLMMMMSARLQLFLNVIQPALKRDELIVSDRFWGCSFAYQVKGSGSISEQDFWSLHQLVMKDLPAYDLIVYLDIDPRIGLKRVGNRETLDSIETREIEFFDRARKGYQLLAKELVQMKTIDASQSVDEVSAQLKQLILTWCQEKSVTDCSVV